MVINRAWAMPSKHTFKIKPIAELLAEEVCGGLWIDPFAGGSRIATITNDINPLQDTDYHLDALEFLCTFQDASVDGVLYDPPYSVRQVAECYKHFGYPVTQETTRADWYTKHKREIRRILKPGGKAICFGWNSNGIGGDGFEKIRILLVPHGGVHNDTIVTVDRKRVDQQYFQFESDILSE